MVNLDLRKSCEVESVDCPEFFLCKGVGEVHGSSHLTCEWSCFENVVISLVLEGFSNKCLRTMSVQNSKSVVFHWFYR